MAEQIPNDPTATEFYTVDVGGKSLTGDVMLYYAAKLEPALAGATMTVRATNSLAGVLAENLPLAKVPTEGNMTAPTVDAFVWLDGNPAGLTSKTYTKAGVITITAEPDMTSGLTPKTTTP